MSDIIDAGMLELLASKSCHDLISPIGAVNNGLELMEEMGPDGAPDAIELIAYSAQQASAKLQAFRMAYGAGGADGNIKPEDVYKTIEQIISADKKITQNWDARADLGPVREQSGFCKILTCAMLLAIEALPKGGKLNVSNQSGEVIIRVEGVNAGLRGKVEEALNLKIARDKLEPNLVHACMSGLMAKTYGFKISALKPSDGFAEFQIAAA